MRKIRDYLKGYFTALIGDGQPLSEFTGLTVFFGQPYTPKHLLVFCLNDEYADDGDQSGAACNSNFQVSALCQVEGIDEEGASNEAETLAKTIFKFLRAEENRRLGADWIVRTLLPKARFVYGHVVKAGITYKIASFQIEIRYRDDPL